MPLGSVAAVTSARVAAAERADRDRQAPSWGPCLLAGGYRRRAAPSAQVAAAERVDEGRPLRADGRPPPSARMGAAYVQGRSHGVTGRRRGCRAPPWGALLPRGWPPSGAASLLCPALPFSLLRGEIRMRVRVGLIARCTRDVPMVPLLLLFFFSRSKIGLRRPAVRRHSSSTLPKDEVVVAPSKLQQRRS